MATDHRGTPIHAGKRTNDEVHASRLAQLMTTQATRYWNNMNLYADETPEETQIALDKYRNNRDTLGSDNRYVQGDANLISSAFKNRHNDKYARPLMPIPGNSGPRIL
jgi:hypothetical protein